MATAPVLAPQTALEADATERSFRRLASVWKTAVVFLSSSRKRETHPAYLEIIDLGLPVVPFLLHDLEQNETHWFTALKAITGADPIPESDAGNIPRMKEAWLNWARANGYRW